LFSLEAKEKKTAHSWSYKSTTLSSFSNIIQMSLKCR